MPVDLGALSAAPAVALLDQLPDGWSIAEHGAGLMLRDASDAARAVLMPLEGDNLAGPLDLQLLTRYQVRRVGPMLGPGQAYYATIDTSDGSELAGSQSETWNLPDSERPAPIQIYIKAEDDAHAVAVAWLYDHLPDWRDPKAYWED